MKDQQELYITPSSRPSNLRERRKDAGKQDIHTLSLKARESDDALSTLVQQQTCAI